jgi:hypothetical protein
MTTTGWHCYDALNVNEYFMIQWLEAFLKQLAFERHNGHHYSIT